MSESHSATRRTATDAMPLSASVSGIRTTICSTSDAHESSTTSSAGSSESSSEHAASVTDTESTVVVASPDARAGGVRSRMTTTSLASSWLPAKSMTLSDTVTSSDAPCGGVRWDSDRTDVWTPRSTTYGPLSDGPASDTLADTNTVSKSSTSQLAVSMPGDAARTSLPSESAVTPALTVPSTRRTGEPSVRKSLPSMITPGVQKDDRMDDEAVSPLTSK